MWRASSREQLGEFALRPAAVGGARRVRAAAASSARSRDRRRRQHRPAGIGIDASTEAAVRAALTLEDLASRSRPSSEPAVIVEGRWGSERAALEAAARTAAEKRGLADDGQVSTYLAEASSARRSTDRPSSLVTATDSGPSNCLRCRRGGGPDKEPGGRPPGSGLGSESDRRNQWAVDEAQGLCRRSDLEVDFFLRSCTGPTTHTAAFTLLGAPVSPSAALQPTSAPPTTPASPPASSLSTWDPPFPVNLAASVRRTRSTGTTCTNPEGVARLETQRTCEARSRNAFSIRIKVPTAADADAFAGLIGSDLRRSLPPQAIGISIPARRLAIEASAGADQFGESSPFFSFFLVVSALLLAVLFFRLGVEQRLRQIGILRAARLHDIAHLRRMLLRRHSLPTVGGALGVVGAVVVPGG